MADDENNQPKKSRGILKILGFALGGLLLVGAGLGAGFSQGSIGSAAVGMLAEDSSKFGPALIFTALPESIVILGALPLFL